MSGELRVNPAELTTGAMGLENAANSIPAPLPQFTSNGTDALSTAATRYVQGFEAPILENLPKTRDQAVATAQNILRAAGLYEQADQQGAETVQQASSTSTRNGVSSGGEASSQVSQMATQMAQMAGQMAMQMGQLAASVPQGVAQGVSQGVQQISQLAGMGSKSGADLGEVGKESGAAGATPEERKPEERRGGEPTEDKDRDEKASEPRAGSGGGSGGERAPVDAPSVPLQQPQAAAVPEAAPCPAPAPIRVSDSDDAIDL